MISRIPKLRELRPVERALTNLFRRLKSRAPSRRAQEYVARIVEHEMAETLGLPVGHA